MTQRSGPSLIFQCVVVVLRFGELQIGTRSRHWLLYILPLTDNNFVPCNPSSMLSRTGVDVCQH